MTHGYEPDLLNLQLSSDASIFACNDYEVFTGEAATLTSAASQCTLPTTVVDVRAAARGDMSIPSYTTNSWLNVENFLAAWASILKSGRYLNRDYTVKTDPDAVFFPQRLRPLLPSAPGPTYLLNCNKFYRAMYGSVEVISREAVQVFGERGPDCKASFVNQTHWGEDWYLQRCFFWLGLKGTARFGMVSDFNGHCTDDVPDSCLDGDQVAFHPFKSVDRYGECLG
eukprot:CAMPEP_0115284640 /NCGR_PEP_ID=MMETSP0270-20121206/61003_1 /TAXON_ID=71861 /ORGANISM="Scrippsiella trochoidea, Strain CCMP3099" /LENGTH=225 /DNA_ID=CAMNT_0002701605 /DNA_START=17 /DNA_END=691 /DNA_ORIENTATION=+